MHFQAGLNIPRKKDLKKNPTYLPYFFSGCNLNHTYFLFGLKQLREQMTIGPICSPRCLLLLLFFTKNYYASIFTILGAILTKSLRPLLYEFYMSCEIFNILSLLWTRRHETQGAAVCKS